MKPHRNTQDMFFNLQSPVLSLQKKGDLRLTLSSLLSGDQTNSKTENIDEATLVCLFKCDTVFPAFASQDHGNSEKGKEKILYL